MSGEPAYRRGPYKVRDAAKGSISAQGYTVSATKSRIKISLPQEDLAALAEIAHCSGYTFSALITIILQDWLSNPLEFGCDRDTPCPPRIGLIPNQVRRR